MKVFTLYPEYKMVVCKPYKATLQINNEISETVELDDVLACQDEFGNRFLYFKKVKALYRIVESSGLIYNIIHRVGTKNSYNLFNVLNGKIRFPFNLEPLMYSKNKKIRKLHSFGFWSYHKKEWFYMEDISEIYNPNLFCNQEESSKY